MTINFIMPIEDPVIVTATHLFFFPNIISYFLFPKSIIFQIILNNYFLFPKSIIFQIILNNYFLFPKSIIFQIPNQGIDIDIDITIINLYFSFFPNRDVYFFPSFFSHHRSSSSIFSIDHHHRS
ncbi:hypothetical protein RND81_14G090000 [Saponaria officinalis]|uniref:Uncharacterized protein n=1 Tax=Saponaria officinalis TaxID=3572 RepID=A0AAW1GMH0_SAPOF